MTLRLQAICDYFGGKDCEETLEIQSNRTAGDEIITHIIDRIQSVARGILEEDFLPLFHARSSCLVCETSYSKMVQDEEVDHAALSEVNELLKGLRVWGVAFNISAESIVDLFRRTIPRILDDYENEKLIDWKNALRNGLVRGLKRAKISVINEYLKSRRISQRKLAEEFGVSSAAVSGWFDPTRPVISSDNFIVLQELYPESGQIPRERKNAEMLMQVQYEMRKAASFSLLELNACIAALGNQTWLDAIDKMDDPAQKRAITEIMETVREQMKKQDPYVTWSDDELSKTINEESLSRLLSDSVELLYCILKISVALQRRNQEIAQANKKKIVRK